MSKYSTMSNRNPGYDKAAHELWSWWTNDLARLRLRLRTIREDHYNDTNFRVGICFHMGKDPAEYLTPATRKRTADRLRRLRADAYRQVQFLPAGKPTSSNAVRHYRKLARVAHRVFSQVSVWNMEAGSNAPTYLGDLAHETKDEARAAIRLARIMQFWPSREPV